MNIPFLFASRYLFSKKSTHAINIISGVSMVGVAVATMALVVTLSVFNGFHDLVASFFTTFDPQLKIVPAMGKAAEADDPLLTEVKSLPQVEMTTEVVEDMALAVYGKRQAMVIIKGVEDNFNKMTRINEALIGDGEFELHAADLHFGIPGIGLAVTLGTGYYYNDPIRVFAPRREGQLDMMEMESNFVEDELYSPGVLFNMKQSRYDRNYMLTDIAFARNLFDRQGMISQLEIRLKRGSDLNAVKTQIKGIVGDKYKVLDRYEQQEDTFRIMKIEKLIAYIFLTFILIVACFNIISSLSMLVIEKKEDVTTLRNLGADDQLISRIFLYEGCMITAIGAVIGIGIGLLLCWIQQEYGIVSLGRSTGNFVITAYPVSVHYTDVAVIFLTVLTVGFISVKLVPKRAASQELS